MAHSPTSDVARGRACTKDREKDIEELVCRVVAATQPVQMILFGSAAKDTMTAHSDLDILVVVSDGTHRGHTTKRIYLSLYGLGFATDVVVVTESDIQKHRTDPYAVVSHALEQGKELYRAPG